MVKYRTLVLFFLQPVFSMLHVPLVVLMALLPPPVTATFKDISLHHAVRAAHVLGFPWEGPTLGLPQPLPGRVGTLRVQIWPRFLHVVATGVYLQHDSTKEELLRSAELWLDRTRGRYALYARALGGEIWLDGLLPAKKDAP